jgi:hypothetical protein
MKQKLSKPDPEFQVMLSVVRNYTPLSEAQLWSLFQLCKEICLKDVAGQLVECGAAGGGAAALMAAVNGRYSRRARQVFVFDTLVGMTAASASTALPYEVNPFAAGSPGATSSSPATTPEVSLLEVTRKLGVAHLVRPVPGAREQTLPARRAALSPISFLHCYGDAPLVACVFDNLFDQLAPGSRIQIDDSARSQACRTSVVEFLQRRAMTLELHPIDESAIWLAK